MPEIEVANARKLPPPAEWPPWFVYVGRASPRHGLAASPLANPYRVGQWDTAIPPHTMTPEDCVYRYRVWWAMVPNGLRLVELRRLRDLLAKHGRLTLVCWCAPSSCHADVIREHLLKEARP